jgi:HEAT repeat protein
MLKRLRPLALSLSLATSSAALAAPPATLTPGAGVVAMDARFEEMLRGIDVVPPSPEAFLSAFPDAPARLATTARDASRDAWTRLRALSLLSFFPTPATAAVLTGLAADPSEDLRGEATLTLARVFGSTSGAAADGLFGVIGRALRDPSAVVREKAVRALRWCRDDRALGLLAEARRDRALRSLADVTAARRARHLGR